MNTERFSRNISILDLNLPCFHLLFTLTYLFDLYVNIIKNCSSDNKTNPRTCYGCRIKYTKVNWRGFRVNVFINVCWRKWVQRCSACTHKQLRYTKHKQIERRWAVSREAGIIVWGVIADDTFLHWLWSARRAFQDRLIWTGNDLRKGKQEGTNS